MGKFNYIGLIIIILIMIPNVIFAAKNKDGFENLYKNKAVELFENIGRYGCFLLMIFNIPDTYKGFWFNGGLAVYVAVNGVLVAAYLLGWVFIKSDMAKAILLSVIPSLVFLFSGAAIISVPLIACAAVFAIFHVLLSVKNASLKKEKK